MTWKWRNGQTETCQFDYLEDEEGWTILEASGVTTNDNPHLDLIASAPELLETLETILEKVATTDLQDDELAQICREAISKAKGE